MPRLRAPAVRARLPALALAFLAGLGLALGYHAAPTPPAPPETGGYAAGITILPTVEVYVNGHKVYEKIGDPPTENIFRLFVSVLVQDGSLVNAADDDFIDTTGATRPISGHDEAGVILAVSNGTATFSPTTRTLPGTIMWSAEGSVEYSMQGWWIVIAGTVIIDQPMNITWVGLFSDFDGVPGFDPADVLLFADPVDPPIEVRPGDVVTIVYNITIPRP